MSSGNSFHFKRCGSRDANYYCICEPGFTGDHCKINIDECASNPCVHGKCVDGINKYDCVCKNGYWGKNCEKKMYIVRGESWLSRDTLNLFLFQQLESKVKLVWHFIKEVINFMLLALYRTSFLKREAQTRLESLDSSFFCYKMSLDFSSSFLKVREK